MIGFLKNWRGRRERQRRFLLSLEKTLRNHGASLVALSKRQADLYDSQTMHMKIAATGLGQSEMIILALASADEPERERIRADLRKIIANCEAGRKCLLDRVAQMESESDANRCRIEQMEEALNELKM